MNKDSTPKERVHTIGNAAAVPSSTAQANLDAAIAKRNRKNEKRRAQALNTNNA